MEKKEIGNFLEKVKKVHKVLSEKQVHVHHKPIKKQRKTLEERRKNRKPRKPKAKKQKEPLESKVYSKTQGKEYKYKNFKL